MFVIIVYLAWHTAPEAALSNRQMGEYYTCPAALHTGTIDGPRYPIPGATPRDKGTRRCDFTDGFKNLRAGGTAILNEYVIWN